MDRGVFYYFLAKIVDIENLYAVLQNSKFLIEISDLAVMFSEELIYFCILLILQKDGRNQNNFF